MKIKKSLKFMLGFMIIIFILPAICTKTKVKGNAEIALNEKISQSFNETDNNKYDYTKFKTIKLYHSSTKTIEEIGIEEYLYGVVAAEMPADYNLEAIKAQAIVSRTYTLYHINNGNNKHKDADICDDSSCCQAWISKEDRMKKWDEDKKESNWKKITTAVNETSGKVITYNGELIDAFFHSNSGGTTETAANVWGGTNFPYLQSVETSGESEYSQYSSEVKVSRDDLINKLKEKYPDIKIDFNNKDDIKITDYTESGRVKTIKFGNISIAGTEVRSIFGLKSTNFSIEINDNDVIFSVTGYGHGVGMSQTGADSMAKNGSSFEDIIKHFYTGVEITFVNDL